MDVTWFKFTLTGERASGLSNVVAIDAVSDVAVLYGNGNIENCQTAVNINTNDQTPKWYFERRSSATIQWSTYSSQHDLKSRQKFV